MMKSGTMQPQKLIANALAGWLPGGNRRCVFCGHRIWRFTPYRLGSRGVPPLMLALGVVGSDVDHFECPRCGSHDRERHLLQYLQASGLAGRLPELEILHFAPEKRLARWIAKQAPRKHLCCDLSPAAPDIERVDMQAMPFEDAGFDLVLANHVLEHVSDLGKALAEVHRVLRPGGHLIAQTPYSPKLSCTWADSGIDTALARLHAYGQEDHVRLFGRDIFGLIEAAGFESKVHRHEELLEKIDAVKTGVNSAEPFFLFRKRTLIS